MELRKISEEARAELRALAQETGERRLDVWGGGFVGRAPAWYGRADTRGCDLSEGWHSVEVDPERYPALAAACEIRTPNEDE